MLQPSNTAVLVPVAELTPWDRNPRRITEPRWLALVESIRLDPDGLWGRPLQVTTGGVVYAGNMRLRAVQHLGWRDVPAVVRSLTPGQVRDIAIRDNTSAGEWDDDLLAELLAEVEAEAPKNIEAVTGIAPATVDAIMRGAPDPLPSADLGWTTRTCPNCGHEWKDL